MRILFFIIFTLIGHNLFSQNFVFSQGDTLTKTFEINQYSWAHTKIENLSDTTVIYQWEIITYEHPPSWYFSICDFEYCYTSGETEGSMSPAASFTEEAFFTLNIEADIVDTGFYQILFWNQALPEITDTLTIIMIATPSYSSLPKTILSDIPSYYFDPITTTLNCENPTNEILDIVIYNQLGQIILNAEIAENSNQSIYLPNLTIGLYIIKSSKLRKQTFEISRFYMY